MKMGPKPRHLELVDAVAEVKPPSSMCGGRTKSGGSCRNPSGRRTAHEGAGQCWLHDGQVEEGSPCPLPLDKLEQRIWDQITDQLSVLRLNKAAFWTHIYGLVIALAGLHTARQSAKLGATVKGENGAMKKHPSSTVVNQMLAHIRQYSNDLGLNPSALAAMDLQEEAKPKSRMEELIEGRR